MDITSLMLNAMSVDTQIFILEKLIYVCLIIAAAYAGGASSSGAFCYYCRGDFKKWSDGRSKCDSCGHELSYFEILPAINYIVQKGKCKHCGAPIPYTCFVADLVGISLGICTVVWGDIYLSMGMHWYHIALFILFMVLLMICATSDLYDQMLAPIMVLGMTLVTFIFRATLGELKQSLMFAGVAILTYMVVWFIQQAMGKGAPMNGIPEVVGFGSADLMLFISLANMFSLMHLGLICLSGVFMFKVLSSTVRKLTFADGPSYFPMYPFCCIGMLIPLGLNSVMINLGLM